MIPITYFRSSSLKNWHDCEQQYFMTYVLGKDTSTPRIRTDMGTVVHKVLEILAIVKKEFQDSGSETVTVEDGVAGTITVCWDDFIKKTPVSDRQVDKINKSRSASSIYIDKPFIEYGHERAGRDFLNDIIQRVFNYYTKKYEDVHPQWHSKTTIREIVNWCWMTCEVQNGAFDPRFRNIVQPEQQFEFELPFDWAEYYYDLPEGAVSGRIKLKGTIDLITEIDGVYEVVDYKSGARKNWATDQVKTYKKLERDIQLLFYHYAMSLLYPDMPHPLITILFIRDGGPFTLSFGDAELAEMEAKLKYIVESMHTTQQPGLLDKNRKKGLCRFCKFAKAEGKGKSYCQLIEDKIRDKGIEQTIIEETEPGFKIGTYSAPGE